MHKFFWIITFCFFTCFRLHGNEEVIQSLCKIFAVPLEEVLINNLEQEFLEQHGELPLIAWTLEDKQGRFAPMKFIAASEGKVLPENFISFIKKQWDENQNDNKTEGFTKTELEDGMYAFEGLAGFGPGAETELIYLHWPKNGVELAFTISIPGDPPIARTSINEEHLELIGERIKNTKNKVIVQLGDFVRSATAKNDESLENLQSQVKTTSHDGLSHDTQRNKTESSEIIEKKDKSRTLQWFYWILGLLILGGVGVLVRNSRKGSSAR